MKQITLQRKNELKRITIEVCKLHFNKEEQQRLYGAEREYADGDSWLANLYLVYENDYVRIDTFFEGELQELFLDRLDWKDEEVQYCQDRVCDLLALYMNVGKFNPDMSHDLIGLNTESILFKA